MPTPDVGRQRAPASAWYRWSSTPDELVSSYAAFNDTGEIPLLIPAASDRRRHWSEVLDWYGRGGVTPLGSRAASHVDVLACVTPEFWPIVSAFAALTGRRAVALQSGRVPAPVVFDAATTVTFVGRPNDFPMAYLQRLAISMTQPWGLLPVVDSAGLSFVLAKCLADAEIGTQRWGVVDAMNQRFRSYRSVDSPLAAESAVEALTTGDWDVLALHAHGDNGHCDLNSHVLCGLFGPTEVTLDGRPLDGCSSIDGIRTCKRLRTAAGVLGAGEIRTRRLLLISCTTFSVAGDLYPSNVSLIVSALEGYAASVLSCDHAVPLNDAAARSLVEMAAAGTAMAALREIENDYHHRSSGSRPFFLAGDASDGLPAPAVIRLDTEVRIDEPATVKLVTVDGLTDSDSVISVSPPGALAVRGRRMIRLICDDSRTPVRVSAADAMLEAHRKWAGDFGQKLAEARRVTLALNDFGFDAEIRVLERALGDADLFAHRVAAGVELSVREGIWAHLLEQIPQMAQRLAVGFDAAMARIVADGPLQLNTFEQLLVDGLSLGKIERSGSCDCCESPIHRYHYVGQHAGVGETHVVQCPHCGPRECRPADAPPARIELLADQLAPEVPAPLRVVTTADLLGAQIVLQLKDSGRGELWWQHLGTIDAVAMDYTPTPPAESTADLATLRVAIVSDFRVSYYRLRRPCFVSR